MMRDARDLDKQFRMDGLVPSFSGRRHSVCGAVPVATMTGNARFACPTPVDSYTRVQVSVRRTRRFGAVTTSSFDIELAATGKTTPES